VNWFQTFMSHFTTESAMALLLLILIIGVVAALLKLHFDQSDRIDLEELVLTNDKIDEQKFMRFGAWIISTWGFVYLVVNNNLSEWYFVGYIGVWVSNAIFDKYISNKNRQNSRDQYDRYERYDPRETRYRDNFNPNDDYRN
jgi:hypothetical protein